MEKFQTNPDASLSDSSLLSSNLDENIDSSCDHQSTPLANKSNCSQGRNGETFLLSSDDHSQLYPPSPLIPNEAVCSQEKNNDSLLFYSDEQFLNDVSMPSSDVSSQPSIFHAIASPITSDNLGKDFNTSNQIEENTNLRSFSINLTRDNSILRAESRPGTHCRTPLSMQLTKTPKVHSSAEIHSFSTQYAKAHHKSIFLSMSDKRLFKTAFSHLIKEVLNRSRVSRKKILETARESKEFAPLYNSLISKFSQTSADQKIINNVRTLGNSKRPKVQNSSSYGEDPRLSFDIYSPSLNSSSRKRKLRAYLYDTRTKIHTKSIFASQNDEILFRELFSNYIDDVAKTRTVSKIDIITRLKTDKRVIPLVDHLKVRYPDEAYSKLVTKIRTLGYTLRKNI